MALELCALRAALIEAGAETMGRHFDRADPAGHPASSINAPAIRARQVLTAAPFPQSRGILTLCSATGMRLRTRLICAVSIRAETTPTPSEAFATTCPQGSAMSEWPKV